MSRLECPKCGSSDILTERRIDGNSTCQECGHSDRTTNFDLVEACKAGCGKFAEGAKYDLCKECWWNQDPRNVKNGGTVKLETFMKSLNRYIVETYKEDRALKATVNNGFAMVQQKVKVVGLKLLADAVVSVGADSYTVPAGAVAFIKEASLQSQPWAKASLSAEGIEGDFMIVDPVHVEFVSKAE